MARLRAIVLQAQDDWLQDHEQPDSQLHSLRQRIIGDLREMLSADTLEALLAKIAAIAKR